MHMHLRNWQRNFGSRKTVPTEQGQAPKPTIPRDRQATFEPRLVAKCQRQLTGFDERVISMYAHDMSVREVAGHFQEIQGMELSPDLTSTITYEALAEVEQWQHRPVEAIWKEPAGHEFAVLARRKFSTDKGAVQPRWAFPLQSNLKGYLRLFSGYGYSLIDYNACQRVIGLGVQINFR